MVPKPAKYVPNLLAMLIPIIVDVVDRQEPEPALPAAGASAPWFWTAVHDQCRESQSKAGVLATWTLLPILRFTARVAHIPLLAVLQAFDVGFLGLP